MTIDTTALKQGADIVSVIGAYTRLKKIGVEYCGPCPIHGGDGDNFYVNPRKGIWRCFSRGCDECDEGNDVIGFIRRVEGVSFQQACEKLGATEWKPKAPIKQKAPPKPERVACPPPSGAGEPDMSRRDVGEPTKVWIYRDVGGAPLMYVARYDAKDGKEIRCFTWSARPGESHAWHCMHYNRGERPLYNLDQITAKPLAPVIIVEGEKAADAAAALLPQYVATTWPGGAGAWRHANFEPLKGRRVDLWPDADAPGREAMEKLAALLVDPRGLGCHGKLVDTAELPDGFDAADWEGDDIVGWLRERAKPYTAREPIEPPPAEPPPPDIPPDADPDGEAPADLPAEMSEDFIAERFAEEHGNSWRYVKTWGAWYEWRKHGWYRDDKALVDRLAVEITRKALYWPEAKRITQADQRRINSRRTAGAVRDIAVSHRRIAATVDQWDRDPWLLGVPGGVVDLRKGKLLEAKPHYYITKRTSVAPADGECPLWIALLERVMQGDPALMAYIQRYCGYILTGETREECFAFVYGPAQTGKSTFIRVLSEILGDYHCKASMETFTESRHERHSEELAVLVGARLVTSVETEEGRRWNESRIKALTGRDRIRARFMRENSFEFDPQFKLLIAGNHAPHLRNVDEAMRRRLHIIPFTQPVPMDERDDQLAEKLRAEYPQILAWMVRGAIDWASAKLGRPDQIAQAVDTYLESEDSFGEWLNECVVRDPEAKCLSGGAYKGFKNWAEATGEYAMSQKRFVQALKERGFDTKRVAGKRYISGLSLRETDGPPFQNY